MKKCIKNLAVTTMLAGIIAASQSALAQSTFINNDLYMGFQNSAGGGTADYIVNMGPAANIVGGNTVVNLSPDFSKSNFTSPGLSGTNAATILGGVVGGTNGLSTRGVYLTVLRTSNVGIPAMSGSVQPGGLTRAQDGNAMSALSPLAAPAAGAGVLDTSKSWESDVEPALNAGSFYGVTGDNPDSSVTTSTVAYEDLWATTNSSLSGAQPFFYQGYFTINFTGANAVVNFTPKAAPNQLAVPTILSISQVNGTVTVVSTAIPTFHYQLQATASLQPTNWVNVGSAATAISTLVTNTYGSETAPVKFYQISAH